LFLGWLDEYGAEKIILGADCYNRKISTQGWQKNSGIDVIDFIKDYESKNIRYVINTDISKDGMLQGPSTGLYSEIIEQTDVKLIASGGVSSVKDLETLKKIGCEGAIIGKAIYEGKIKLNELSKLC
jgi:phosphoribosylformimino-5-aminoimidazole carboxamide ribotide isomerase